MVLPTVLSIYVIPNTKDPMGGWLPSPSRDLWKILCEKRVNKIYQSEKKKKKKHYKASLQRYIFILCLREGTTEICAINIKIASLQTVKIIRGVTSTNNSGRLFAE